MPKLKAHKGMKKRFRISATGKVLHKRCGSSHLMSHKSGKRVRRLRKPTQIENPAEAERIREAMLERQNVNPSRVLARKLAARARKRTAGTAQQTHPAAAGPDDSSRNNS
jgi:large subunit ribosomal protein L35